MPNEIWRKSTVLAKTGIGTTLLYEKIKQGTFPKPVQISAQRVGWASSEVQAWIDARIAERDSARKAA